MLSFHSSQRYFLYPEAVDLRKGLDALSGLVIDQMKLELTSGDVFIFLNKPRNRIKLLVWDQTGLVLYYKRLEVGTFEWPAMGVDQGSIVISWQTLMLMLEGISLRSVRQRKRYVKTA